MRGDRSGAGVFVAGGPDYLEAVRQKQVFLASTPAAGVTVPIFSNTTQQFLAWNPADSGVLAVLIEVKAGYVSGTMVAGHMCYGYQTSVVAAPPGTTTAALVTNGIIGSTVGPAMKVYSPANPAAALSYLGPMNNSQVVQAATATNSPWTASDMINGKLAIPPGGVFAVAANAAAFVVATISLSWIEVPWP